MQCAHQTFRKWAYTRIYTEATLTAGGEEEEEEEDEEEEGRTKCTSPANTICGIDKCTLLDRKLIFLLFSRKITK